MSTSDCFLINYLVTGNGGNDSPSPIISVTSYATTLNLSTTIMSIFSDISDLINGEISIQTEEYNSDSLSTFCTNISSKLEDVMNSYIPQSKSLTNVGQYLLSETMIILNDKISTQIDVVSASNTSDGATQELTKLKTMFSTMSYEFSEKMLSSLKNGSFPVKGRPPTGKKVKKNPKTSTKKIQDILKLLKILSKNDATLGMGISQLTNAITGHSTCDNNSSSIIAALQAQISTLNTQLASATGIMKTVIQNQIANLEMEILSIETGTSKVASGKCSGSSVSSIQAELDQLLATGKSPIESLTGNVTNYKPSSSSSVSLPITSNLGSRAISNRRKNSSTSNLLTSEQNAGIINAISALENFVAELTLAYQAKVDSGTATTTDSTEFAQKITTLQIQISDLRSQLSTSRSQKSFLGLGIFKQRSNSSSVSSSSNVINKPIQNITRTIQNVGNLTNLNLTGMSKTKKDSLYRTMNSLNITEPYIEVDDDTLVDGYEAFLSMSTTKIDDDNLTLKGSGCVNEIKFTYSLNVNISTLRYLGSKFMINIKDMTNNELKSACDSFGFPYTSVPTTNDMWNLFLTCIYDYIILSYFCFENSSKLSYGLISYEQLLVPQGAANTSNGTIPILSGTISTDSSQVLNSGSLKNLIYTIYSNEDVQGTLSSTFNVLAAALAK